MTPWCHRSWTGLGPWSKLMCDIVPLCRVDKKEGMSFRTQHWVLQSNLKCFHVKVYCGTRAHETSRTMTPLRVIDACSLGRGTFKSQTAATPRQAFILVRPCATPAPTCHTLFVLAQFLLMHACAWAYHMLCGCKALHRIRWNELHYPQVFCWLLPH